jgi:hypothetical protein
LGTLSVGGRAESCSAPQFGKEKKANLVYEVASNVHFGYELANREFSVTKLPHGEHFGHSVMKIISLHTW